MVRKSLFVAVLLVQGAGLWAQTLRAGTVEGLPGFNIENGTLTTPSPYPEFIAALEKDTGAKLVWSAYPTIRLLELAKRGELDLIYPMGFTADRDAALKRSVPTEPPTHDYFAYLAKPTNVADTRLTVGCKAGSPQESWLKAKGYKVQPVNNYRSLMQMLLVGRLPMAVFPEIGFDELASTIGRGKILHEVSTTRNAGFYYSPKFAMAAVFDKAIEKNRGLFKAK